MLAVLWVGVTRLFGYVERTGERFGTDSGFFWFWSLLADPGPGMRQGNTELMCESSGLAGLYITGAS